MTSKTEIWRLIPNHDPYIASSHGRIMNGKTGKILKPIIHSSRGHLQCYAGGGRNATKKFIHRLVLMAFKGSPKEGQVACHRNDEKKDNSIDNLYWGTYRQNTADQIRNGKFYFAVGEANGMTKYSNEIVSKIKSEYTGKRGEQTALAKKYGMHVSNVHLIVHGSTRVS